MSTDRDTAAGGGLRPAIDLAPHRARPVLALVLAILSVPGSTIAWDLPWGGLWIGLPLGLAAIALGVHARRHRARPGIALAAIIVAALALGQMVVYTIVAHLF
jgi:hypothetical protein